MLEYPLATFSNPKIHCVHEVYIKKKNEIAVIDDAFMPLYSHILILLIQGSLIQQTK